MINCQHGNNPVTCARCAEIHRRERADSAMYRRGSGGGAPLTRGRDSRAEATKLIRLIEEEVNTSGKMLPGKDNTFIAGLLSRMEMPRYEPTQPEIFWLRDIKERTCQ